MFSTGWVVSGFLPQPAIRDIEMITRNIPITIPLLLNVRDMAIFYSIRVMGYNGKMLAPEPKAFFLIHKKHGFHLDSINKGFLLFIPAFKERFLCP
jgi:hypothetical protein